MGSDPIVVTENSRGKRGLILFPASRTEAERKPEGLGCVQDVHHGLERVAGLAALILMLPLLAAAGASGDCVRPTYDCALSHLERGDFPAAIRSLEQVLAEAPQDLRTLNLLGIALTGAGRIDEGSQRFRQALDIDSAFYPARKNLAINEFDRGRLAEAQRHLEEVLAHAPDDDVTHLYLAEIYFRRGELQAALPHYEKSRARAIQNPTWILHYATTLLDQGQRETAIAALDEIPEDEAAGRFEAGVALGRSGAHAAAARFFGTARTSSSDPYAAGYNQTLMLIEAGDYDGAIRVAEELFEQGMKAAELYNLASRAYLEAGRIEEGYDALRTAARIEPTVEEHYVDLALICLDHENFDLGLEIVDVGLRYRPDSTMLHLQRGVLLAMKGLVEQAEGEFETARRLAPDASAPYFALALAWMTTGQSDKAVEVLRERVGRESADAMIAYVFGLALVRSGAGPGDADGTEALQAFETSVRLDPQFAGARVELGKLLLKRGDVEAAVTQLEQAVALDPESAASLYQLAQAYRRTGQTARARELLERVSRLNVRERGDDPDQELKRTMIRIVREGTR